MDSSGNWYIADTSNNRIRMVTPAGVISTIAGTATAGSAGNNGPASAAELNAPRGLAVDIFDNLYIADSGNNEVRQITPAGLIAPLRLPLTLNNPVSVATDALGSVYIADSGNNRIVKVTPREPPASSPLSTGPQAVAVDPSGNVLVADPTQIWTSHARRRRQHHDHGAELAHWHRNRLGWEPLDRRTRRESDSSSGHPARSTPLPGPAWPDFPATGVQRFPRN